MATIQIKHVPEEVHHKLCSRAAAAGQSLQQYMLDAVCKQAHVAAVEELLESKRVDARTFGEVHIDPQMVVEILREERDSH